MSRISTNTPNKEVTTCELNNLECKRGGKYLHTLSSCMAGMIYSLVIRTAFFC